MTRKASSADYAAFLKRYFLGVAQEDLLARRPDYLASIALAHRRAGEQRAAGRAVIAILDGRDQLPVPIRWSR